MNIIEAIKSGRPFKRKSWTISNYITNPNRSSFNLDEVIADDWEVQERIITITESQFDEAWSNSHKEGHTRGFLRDDIKKKLGFS